MGTCIDDTKALAASYNRNNAVTYADQWAHARNPSYPDYPNADCTNFASQVLEASALPQINGNHNKDDVNLWFFYNDWFWGYQNSKTWSAANWMNTHLAQYPGRFKYNGSLDRGDIIVIRWHTQDSPADFHVRVTMGYGNSEEFVQGDNMVVQVSSDC